MQSARLEKRVMRNLKNTLIICLTLFCQLSLSDTLEAGKGALGRGHYGTALRALLPLANQGNSEAQTYIGLLYEKGLGVTQSYTEAIGWYEKAGAQDSYKAQHSLGMLYFTGEGVSLDYAAAYEWFVRASDQDFPPSLYMLGLLYHQGHGIDADFDKARTWFLKSARLGSANAQFMYAFMLQSGEGGPSEPKKAMIWALLSEKNGKEDAVAITIPAGMGMTALELEECQKIANECFIADYQSCPD
tara:strand:+ start:1264 stop:1998 length:735 start_codon:yes stop_codon:yes gene_type:complete